MPHPENLKGHEFKPGQSGNPKGRPKGTTRKIIIECLKYKKAKELQEGMTKRDVDEWEEYLMSATSDEITIFAQDPKIPVYARAIARAIATDLKNGKTTTLDRLRDRRFGKISQRVELTGKDGSDLVPARRLSPDEAKELFKSMDNEY